MVKIPSSNCPRVQMIRPVLSGKNWKLKQNIWKIPWELMVIFRELFQIIWVQFTWHVLRIWSKPKKKINPGPFCMIIYTFIIGFEKLTEFFRDTIYLSKVTKHFPPWRVKRCENDVCLYHKERIKRFQMDSVNYEQLISPFIWRILSVLDERNYTCLFRYPGISYGINILHLWILKAEDCVGTDFTHSPLFFPFLTTSITSVHLGLLGASLI